MKTEKRSKDKPAEGPLKGIGDSLQQVHPMTVMNEQVKVNLILVSQMVIPLI